MSILDEIYEQGTNVKRYDHYLLMNCLWHDDTHPSLLVYEEWFRCLSCGEQGKPQKLLQKLSSYSSVPRREEKSNIKNPWYGWIKKYGSVLETCKIANQALKSFPSQMSYLKKRGLTEEVILKIRTGYLDGFYIIPIFSPEKQFSGALSRAGESISGARYFLPKDQDPNLLFSPSWDKVFEESEVYLTFGTIDAISIYQLGKAAISTISGKRCDPTWFQDIRKRINVFGDFGEEKEAGKLVAGLGWRGNLIKYRYPVHCKDANDLLRHNLLQQAISC